MNVITDAFVGASETQLGALGFAGATVVVAHPVQNLTTAELHQLADNATDAVVAAIGTAAERPVPETGPSRHS